jgi:dienelactone hydrolase
MYIAGTSVETGEEVLDTWTNAENKRVLLLAHDICGPFSGRHRQLCDEFAERLGAIVVLPDFFEMKGLCGGYEDEPTGPTKVGFNWFTVQFLWKLLLTKGAEHFLEEFDWKSRKIILQDQILPFFKAKGIARFSMMGFCWGSWLVMKACASPEVQPYIKCALHFHPAVDKTEKDGNDLALCQQVACPQFLLSTRMEPVTWRPGGAAEELLKANSKVSEVVWTQTETEMHGFMTRATMDNATSKEEVAKGIAAAIEFLERHGK